MPSEPDVAPLPYREQTDQAYARDVIATFAVEVVGGRVVLRGACPRCSDVMEYLARGEVVRLPGRRIAAATVDGPEHMVCTCDGDHPGRTQTVIAGCGAFWDLRISEGGAG